MLRIFADASPLTPLIAPGQKLRSKSPRQRSYKTLADSHVRDYLADFLAQAEGKKFSAFPRRAAIDFY